MVLSARPQFSNSNNKALPIIIFYRYANNKFKESHIKTLGIDFISTTYVRDEETKVEVKIWDTAGQERFHTITQQFYRQAQGMIIAFDLTQKKSFENVRTWIDSIYRTAPDATLPKVLVGNKVDLADAQGQRAVLKSEALKIANEHGIQYFETSAKENINIKELMQYIMSQVYENMYGKEQAELDSSNNQPKQSIIIGEESQNNNGFISNYTDKCQC